MNALDPGRMIDQFLKRFATLNDVLQFQPGVTVVIESLDVSVPAHVRKIRKIIESAIEFSEMLGINRVLENDVTMQIKEIIKGVKGILSHA